MTCHELFTLHGVCRENPGLAALIERENLLDAPLGDKSYEFPATVHPLPTDIECYTHGVTPGLVPTSHGVIEKIGALSSPLLSPASANKGYYHSYFSSEFDPLVNFVLKHRPIATYDELARECWGQTGLEALRIKREEALDTFLNYVVPFKSCIQDLESDDLDRRFQGLETCILEAAMTILLVLGAVAQVASLIVKSMTLAKKAGAIARIGIGLVNSLFNPLDGVSDLLKGGTKLLRKGLAHRLPALDDAVTDLRRLSGDLPYGAAATHADPQLIHVGTLGSLEASPILAIRHNGDWYALSRTGKPWGAPLKQFEPQELWRTFKLDKLLPASYSRQLIKKALPASRTKIDDAIRILKDASFDADSGQILKMLLGDDSISTRYRYLNYLDEIKHDFSSISSHNFIMDGSSSDALAAMHPALYSEWRQLPREAAAEQKFMRIYTRNFNKEFHREGYSHNVLADVIVHEAFHGAPNTRDYAYATSPRSNRTGNYQRLDVAGLLNLASGNLRDPDTLKLVEKANAFNNADSFALSTSLLSQLAKDPAIFLENMATMSAALERSRNGYIGWEVLIRLNPV